MNDLLKTLIARRGLLADGAYGTVLRAVAQPGERVEQLNVRAPALVAALAAAYADAEACVLWSNTFGVGLPGFPEAERAGTLRAGVAIARAAAGSTRGVFAALGPMACATSVCGDCARVAGEAGADAVVLETMTRVPEAVAMCAACVAEGMPTAVSYTVQRGRDAALRTLDGVALLDAVAGALAAGAFAVGVNCCDGPTTVLDTVRVLHGAGVGPILARPNAGLPVPADVEVFAVGVVALAEAGAWLVGGCCGTTPAHIAACARGLAAR